jgi:hypothetical protein
MSSQLQPLSLFCFYQKDTMSFYTTGGYPYQLRRGGYPPTRSCSKSPGETSRHLKLLEELKRVLLEVHLQGVHFQENYHDYSCSHGGVGTPPGPGGVGRGTPLPDSERGSWGVGPAEGGGTTPPQPSSPPSA